MYLKRLFFTLSVFSATAILGQAQCPPNTNGLLQGAATVCAIGNSGSVHINSPGFTVVEWVYSTDNQTWISTTGSGNTLTYAHLTQTTHYKASVRYGACNPVFSNVVTITVTQASDAGTIAGASKGCRYTHSGALTLHNYTGTIQNWLVYDTLSKAWNSSGNTNSLHYFSNLATETQYKAVVKNGMCPADTSAIATVDVYLLPEVNFNDPSACLGTTMQFNEDVQKPNEPDNQLHAYLWNFDDGTASTARFPQKTYSIARVYNVTLTATTDRGCSSSQTKAVTVYQNPVADFHATSVCLGDSTRFTNVSTSLSGIITQYSWTFGDMQSAAAQNPVHKYSAAQTYTAGLSVTSEYGCSHYVSKNVQVYHNPVAAFIADPVCLNEVSRFTNLSTGNDGMLNKFSWDFGDAATSPLQHPAYTYATPGTFATKLLVETDKGCRDSVTQSIMIYPLPEVAFSVVDACDGTPVKFTNHTTVAQGSMDTYWWNFGDGVASSEENPEKLYFNATTYNVELLATSDKGCQSRLVQQAAVHKNPVAGFSATNACLHTPAALVNQSRIDNAENLLYQWHLGDGATANIRDVQHTYAQAGNYPIKLVVTSGIGRCEDSISHTVLIYDLPNISAGEDVTGTLGYSVPLHATGGETYRWSPADGLSATHIPNPLAAPKQTTQYTVEGTDINGCVNTGTVTVFIADNYKIAPSNLITPDNNGKNDTWVITNIENYPRARVSIFDQRGKEIFGTRNYRNTWDGRNKNGDVLPDGTYYYVIAFDDSPHIYKGAITILRNK